MSVGIGRAVAVGVSEGLMPLLEDALARAGFRLDGRAPDGASGLRLLRERPADLAVVAAVMPGMDGADFARRAQALRLSVVPGILLLRPRGMWLPAAAALDALGVRTADLPATGDALQAAITALAQRERVLPPPLSARLTALLDQLGVPAHPGRDCLARAVALAWHDRRRLRCMKDDLYPLLARQTGLNPAQAERAMRHAIDVAWRTGEIEQQHRLFGDTIDARRGKPTCGEMIAQLAEELRWEGRL